MSRVPLALNVNDIDEAVGFYTRLFGTEPVKRRPGYANFAVADPPLKLVLVENPGQGGSHHGVEQYLHPGWPPCVAGGDPCSPVDRRQHAANHRGCSQAGAA